MTAQSTDFNGGRKSSDLGKQVFYLSTLVQLEQQLRQAETDRELAYIIVNETLQLVPYQQAVFWEQSPAGRVRIEAVSGTDQVNKDAPYIVFIKRIIQAVNRMPDNKPKALSVKDFDQDITAEWATWSPGELLACPLRGSEGETIGGLLFMRPSPWDTAETVLMERLAGAFAHSRQALKARARSWSSGLGVFGSRRNRLIIAGLGLLLFCLPVRLSVLAPMEIVPDDPVVVAAPMDGAVKDFMVTPNQPVKAGQVLFTLDDIRIRNEYEIAVKTLAVTRADELRARQKAFADEASRADLLLLAARIEQQQAMVDYLAEQLERSRVKAAVNGIAVFSDVNDWLGKPVMVGEKVLSLADPKNVAAEIHLPVADAINLGPGADVRLFFNIAPDRPVAACLYQAAYEARVTPDNILAFRLKARLAENETPPRIGLRGTAKIYGEKVCLIYYLLRRPLAAVRQFVGV